MIEGSKRNVILEEVDRTLDEFVTDEQAETIQAAKELKASYDARLEAANEKGTLG